MEEGVEGVRMMTVHKAKGLEFPVVVLADPTTKGFRDTPSRHVEATRRLWLQPVCGCVPAELREAAAEELARDKAGIRARRIRGNDTRSRPAGHASLRR